MPCVYTTLTNVYFWWKMRYWQLGGFTAGGWDFGFSGVYWHVVDGVTQDFGLGGDGLVNGTFH